MIADDCEFFSESIIEINPLFQYLTDIYVEKDLVKLLNKTNPLPDFIFFDLNIQRMAGKKCLSELKKDTNLKIFQ